MARVLPSGVAVLSSALVVAACTVPDAPRRLEPYAFRLTDTDAVFHWPATWHPIRYYVEPVGALKEYTQLGLTLWQRQFLYGEFRSAVVEDSAAADVIVELNGTAPPDAPLTDDAPVNTCTGQTRVPPLGDVDGTTRLQDVLRVSVRWFPSASPSDIANCLARVTAHEIGHTLGIFAADHAGTTAADLMFSPPSVLRPSERDRATVEQLYHLPADILPRPRSGS